MRYIAILDLLMALLRSYTSFKSTASSRLPAPSTRSVSLDRRHVPQRAVAVWAPHLSLDHLLECGYVHRNAALQLQGSDDLVHWHEVGRGEAVPVLGVLQGWRVIVLHVTQKGKVRQCDDCVRSFYVHQQ